MGKRHRGRPNLGILRSKKCAGALATFLLAGAAGPAAASANTYCVSDPGCVGTNHGSNLQAALDAAAANSGHDRVQVGAATLQAPNAGGFTYDNTTAGNSLELDGAGSTLTHLTAPAPPTNGFATTLKVVGPATTTVSDLAVVTAPKASFSNSRGIKFNGSTIQRVDVSSDPSLPGGTGIELTGTLRESTVTMPNVGGAAAVRVADTTAGTIEDSTLTGYYGVYADRFQDTTPTTATVRRVDITADYSGIYTLGSDLAVENSLIEVTSSFNTNGLVAFTNANGDSSSTVRNSTVIGAETGIWAQSTNAGRTLTFNLNSSILDDVTASIERNAYAGIVNVTTSYSNYTAPNVGNGGNGTLIEEPSNTSFGNPGFVDPAAGDYRLAATSPVRDLGAPGAFAGESPTDLGGEPRISNGRRDMGAYEFQAPQVQCAGRPAIVDTPGGNTITGTSGNDVFAALGGNDTVRGMGGDDVVCGGRGHDRLLGGAGKDELLGEAGNDTLIGGSGRDTLRGGPGKDDVRP